jgi:hypothetical protein
MSHLSKTHAVVCCMAETVKAAWVPSWVGLLVKSKRYSDLDYASQAYY